MRIANAAYDVVFRYLMEDNRVAKLLLSALIEEEIKKLVFKPSTLSWKPNQSVENGAEDREITKADFPNILSMDFAATIKMASGEEKELIIELQKAKYFLEVIRFRKYLGSKYMDENNVISRKGSFRDKGRPILPIYFLGDKLSKDKIPVIRANRVLIDIATKNTVELQHSFIEALTHDAIFVQLPYVKEKRRTDLEKILTVFDTSETKKHFLDVDEKTIPQKYKSVLRRLKKAIEIKEIAEQMNAEDAMISMFQKITAATEAAQQNEKIALAVAQEERKLKEEAKAREEEAKAREEKAKLREEEAKEALISTICNMKKGGLTNEQIASFTGKSIDFITNIGC